MKAVHTIEKRLSEAERLANRGAAHVELAFTSQSTATAQILTGIFLREPYLVELSWDKKPKSDEQKIWTAPLIVDS